MAGGPRGAGPAFPPDRRERIQPAQPADCRRGAAPGGRAPGRDAVKAILILALLAVLACLAGLALGAVPMSPRVIVAALLSPDAPGAAIVRDLRAPREIGRASCRERGEMSGVE